MKVLIIIKPKLLGLHDIRYAAQITNTSLGRLDDSLRRDGVFTTTKYEVRFIKPGIYTDATFQSYADGWPPHWEDPRPITQAEYYEILKARGESIK